MKIALDPYMFRRVPLTDLPGLAADLGYQYLELSPREDFLPFFLHPRAGRAQLAAFRKALASAGVEVCSVLPLYRWSGRAGVDIEVIMKYAGPLLTQVHLADSFDHRASSGLRYIVNPPGSTARVHQHLDIGQGEVDWDVFFRTLAEVGFDGIATVCVFAWEDRARESSLHNLHLTREYLAKYSGETA
jgi:sugar phosphate isomerase/epimerase